jgi:hypothetical protein
VAVCYLHAYRDPSHERATRAAIERALPGVYISLSSDDIVISRASEFVTYVARELIQNSGSPSARAGATSAPAI